jgi:hypothetical protein
MLLSQFFVIFDNFRRKNWRFSQKPMLWSIFLICFVFSQKRQFFRRIFRRKYFKNYNIDPRCSAYLPKLFYFKSLTTFICKKEIRYRLKSRAMQFVAITIRKVPTTFAQYKLCSLDNTMGYRVARLHIFKPKIRIWVNFGGSCNGRCWSIFGHLAYVFYGHLVYFVAIRYILGLYDNFFTFWYVVPNTIRYVLPRKIWQPWWDMSSSLWEMGQF